MKTSAADNLASNTQSVTLPEFLILLVDDRPENLYSLEDLLEKENRRFLKASSGNEALKLVLQNDNIGLILLDVQMPDMDGFEVARLLKANPKTKDISIIFVTAISKDEQFMLRGFSEGAVDYLFKPLDVNITLSKVNVFEKLYYYQQELKVTASELERINQRLEQFVYIVAHDLKSPLSGMITMLSVLEEESQIISDPRLKNYISLLFKASNNLSQMITSMLDYTRISMDQQAMERFDSGELVRQIITFLYPPANIRFDIAEDMPELVTKKMKLTQVFQNLISNAIKYNDKEDARISIGVKDKGLYYEFYVTDNGQGIPEHELDDMFRLFQTGMNKSYGDDSKTGVGLNLLKMLVEEQGGTISVDTEQGTGSTFRFEWKKS